MKKSIFLIILLATISSTYVMGQSADHNSYPIPLTGCADSSLAPIAGKSYNYQAIVNPTGGNFQWWATTNQNFISGGANNISTMLLSPTTTPAGTDLLATSASYGTTTLTDNVDITWSSATLAAAETIPTFVVVQYDAPATGCSNNLKVLKINPMNGFTVDIRNMYSTYDTVAYGVTIDTCASQIAEATYNAAGNNVIYDFGDNQLLFEVVLANFSESATVSFSIADLVAPQTADLAWGYTPATAGSTSLGTGLGNGPVVSTAAVVTDETNTSIGVSIFILATVNNNNYEGLLNTDFTLAVNAENAEGDPDVVNADCTVADFEDLSTQTLLARPTVTETPAPDDFLPVAP